MRKHGGRGVCIDINQIDKENLSAWYRSCQHSVPCLHFQLHNLAAFIRTTKPLEFRNKFLVIELAVVDMLLSSLVVFKEKGLSLPSYPVSRDHFGRTVSNILAFPNDRQRVLTRRDAEVLVTQMTGRGAAAAARKPSCTGCCA